MVDDEDGNSYKKKEINQMKKEIQKIRDFMYSINPYFD